MIPKISTKTIAGLRNLLVVFKRPSSLGIKKFFPNYFFILKNHPKKITSVGPSEPLISLIYSSPWLNLNKSTLAEEAPYLR